MLREIYYDVSTNYRFEAGTKPEDYIGSVYHDELNEIYSALQTCRGHDNFVKTRNLPHCDYYVPNPGFILEFDESQHFTFCRKISLTKYPSNLQLGFEAKKWIRLCQELNKKDNDPPYRDEQRAWYDTLRDFLPSLIGLKPTIRLYSRDFHWCSLNPSNPSHIERFKSILEANKQEWSIEIKKEPNPSIARIIIARNWDGNIGAARKLLLEICDNWPKGITVKFLITCGGFLTFDWPKSLAMTEVESSTKINEDAVNILVEEARSNVGKLLDDSLCQKLVKFARYITIGIDTRKRNISLKRNKLEALHAELVFLEDLKTGKYHWTGKSYPTSNQENKLVRIDDLHTHFFTSHFGKVMILGCHDLTIFNPRSDAKAKGWRKKLKKDFLKISKDELPKYVLQHPHMTDSTRTWTASWNALLKSVPVDVYASAGRYYNNGNPCRSDLEDVLSKTRKGEIIDFIVGPVKVI